MKTAFKYLVLTALPVVIALSSCTRNNGDIGDWFGTWKLISIETDGAADAGYEGNIMWKFQNNIISMDMLLPDSHTVCSHWGTWSAVDDILFLDFSHSDNDNPSGTGIYEPFDVTHIPAGKSELDVVDISSSRLELRLISSDSKVYTYKFKKWG